MSEIVSINYCQPGTKFHVWIFTATHKSDPRTNKYLCALSRLAQRAHNSHHNFYPRGQQQIFVINVYIYHNSQGQVKKSRCLYFISPCLSICQMSLGWMRRESEAIESLVCGQTWHWAESSKQDDRQSRAWAESWRINPRYHELFRAGRGKVGIVSPLCTGRRHNVQHMAWWYTSSVGGRSPVIFLLFY